MSCWVPKRGAASGLVSGVPWPQGAGSEHRSGDRGQALPGRLGHRESPPTLWMLLCWACPRWGWEAQRGPGDWHEAGCVACPVHVCANKVATAQPVGNQEINCVGERERRERLGLLCGWV